MKRHTFNEDEESLALRLAKLEEMLVKYNGQLSRLVRVLEQTRQDKMRVEKKLEALRQESREG